MEGRLSTAQSRLHKDAIRTAYLALAEHDVRTGRDHHKSLSEAMITNDDSRDAADPTAGAPKNNNNNSGNSTVKNINVNNALFRAMDFCATRFQTAQIGLLIIESAINAGDFIIVKEYVERLGVTMKTLQSINATNNNKSMTDSLNYQESIIADIGVKVQIAKGIERMVSGDYVEAANVLIPLVMKGSGLADDNNNIQQQNSNKDHHMLYWPGVTAPEDVALYAGLMCLVTRDRSKMLALADHPEALELVPSVKELLLCWSRANYAPCMRALSECSGSIATGTAVLPKVTLSQPLLPLRAVVDVYLTPRRWDALVQTIRETCLVEYLRPYQRVKLESLRDLFFPTPASDDENLDSVIDALADLMDRQLLPSTARLDCREKILFRADAPCDPGPNIRAMEERILDDSHAMLVRLACLEHDLVIKSDPSGVRRGKTGKIGERGRQRGKQRQSGAAIGRRGPGAMTDSSDSEADDEGGIYGGGSYENQIEGAAIAPAGEMGDAHMIDANPPSPTANAAMNPEDMY